MSRLVIGQLPFLLRNRSTRGSKVEHCPRRGGQQMLQCGPGRQRFLSFGLRASEFLTSVRTWVSSSAYYYGHLHDEVRMNRFEQAGPGRRGGEPLFFMGYVKWSVMAHYEPPPVEGHSGIKLLVAV